MNCKPGDLAILIRSYCGNEGKICKVLEPCAIHGHGWWVVEFPHKIRWANGPDGFDGAAEDRFLRPIRPGDLEDETPTVRELEAA